MKSASYTHTTYTRTPCRGIFGSPCEHILSKRIVKIENKRFTFIKTNASCVHNESGYCHKAFYRVGSPSEGSVSPVDYDNDKFTLMVNGVIKESNDLFTPENESDC